MILILIDFSALLHQNVYGAISGIKPEKDDNDKYITSQYIAYVKYLIIQEILSLKKKFQKYGNVVLCLDSHAGANWRLDVYKPYKGSRASGREKSPINWGEVYSEINALTDALSQYSSLHVVTVDRAEGDDVILCLAELCAKANEQVMIISADKDLIQVQKYPKIYQYSPITKKFVSSTDKDSTMQDWLHDHVYLGDASDEVPSVFKNLVFTPEFEKYLAEKHLNITPSTFEQKPEMIEKVSSAFGSDIFKKLKIGPATLKKLFKNDDAILKNSLLFERVKRNEKLVLMEYIPEYIRDECKSVFLNLRTPKKYYRKDFEKYLIENSCENLIMQCNELETGIIDTDFFDF